MYISKSTYGGIDWHDARTVYKQLKSNGSCNIEGDKVSKAIADDIAREFPYVKNIWKKVMQALSEKSCFRFMIRTEEKDNNGSTVYRECGIYETDEGKYYENEAVFDGEKMKLTQDFAYGQVFYITTYQVEDIPDDQVGYIVTEDFLAPTKGVDLVERLYHDIFDELNAAQNYANKLKPHKFEYSKSIITFLVCNRDKVVQTEWYQLQKEIMELMKVKGQTYLDDSFSIFPSKHKENLDRLSSIMHLE